MKPIPKRGLTRVREVRRITSDVSCATRVALLALELADAAQAFIRALDVQDPGPYQKRVERSIRKLRRSAA